MDFDELKKANPDIYAWITIPEANVDYPILQSETDNSFYLTHTVNGKKSVYGSIYTENYNAKDFSDFNTVVYGHNMKNGTMFGSLKKFRDANFFNQNRYITVYMPQRILKYEIFAAVTWDNKHILLSRSFENEINRITYIEDIFSVRDINSQIKKDITVTEKDKIITLSTCMNDKEKRFLVSGVLVYDSDLD
jgi:sortase B